MKQTLNRLIKHEDLTYEEAHEVMSDIMDGAFSDSEIAGFLMALAVKGETAPEIAGFASAMREKMVPVSISVDAIDMCGTGGDGMGTFNISTAASFVVAGAGVPVAKHGNRSISSKSGSADVLGELGVDIQMPAAKVAENIDEIGVGFLFAPAYHPAMRHVMPARKSLAVRTVFNILGPLCNPAQVKRQVIGLFDGALTEKIAEVLKLLGHESALLVHGADGMDEITSTGVTNMAHLDGGGSIQSMQFEPDQVGYEKAKVVEIQGGNPAENADIMRALFDGKKDAYRDVVVLNAAAGIMVGGKAKDFKAGVTLAEESIDSGAAKDVLQRLVSA
jgi:anthranilate phosphoribosyltransferase